MNGPQHYKEAELLLLGQACEYACPHSGCVHESTQIARAQAHATLALAAATALNDGDIGNQPPEWDAWHEAAGVSCGTADPPSGTSSGKPASTGED